MYYDIKYIILTSVIGLISMLVQSRLKSKFAHYTQLSLRNGMSGKEIAEKMLRDNGINDVQVISTPGRLTDHYNPIDKTVNLSEAVYNERNAAAAAVAAHECGHAVQHAQAYSWLIFRSKMVPMVNVAGNFSFIVIMAGLVLLAVSNFIGTIAFLIGIVLFSITTLFTLVTLPVEYDASNRALAWLKQYNMVTPDEYAGAEDALKWAARTYLISALSSVAQLFYFIMMFLGNRNRE